MRWWEGRRGTNRILIGCFAFLACTAIVVVGVFTQLLSGESRHVSVTMRPGITDAQRQTVKDLCGGLPGISVIAEGGNQSMQNPAPVRFRLANNDAQQESAFYACLNGFPTIVQGFDPPTRED